jgi:hypothetical protein
MIKRGITMVHISDIIMFNLLENMSLTSKVFYIYIHDIAYLHAYYLQHMYAVSINKMYRVSSLKRQ